MVEIGRWRKVLLGELVNVKGELRPNVAVRALVIGDRMPVLQSQGGKRLPLKDLQHRGAPRCLNVVRKST